MKPREDRVRESTIEAELVDKVAAAGGRAYKFASPGRRAVPDRLILMPIADEEHQRIVAKYVRFVEVKAPGERPTKPQAREHEKLRRLGHWVAVLNGMFETDPLVSSFK